MVHSRGHLVIQPAGGQSKDIGDGNERPEKVHAGGHSLGICCEWDPITQWLSGKAS